MPAKRPASVLSGRDTEGTKFGSPAEMWEVEAGSATGKQQWYSKGLDYWKALPASLETVLGGYQVVSPADVRESDAFLLQHYPPAGEAAGRPLRAADVGAGVGRVTQQLLLRRFDEVDVFEPVAHYLAKAEADIGIAPTVKGAPRVVTFTCQALEDFTPPAGRYDVIWAQARAGPFAQPSGKPGCSPRARCSLAARRSGVWATSPTVCAASPRGADLLPALTCCSDDFVRFLTRCAAGLRPEGRIFVKENNCASGFVVDKEDSSITRSDAYFQSIFPKAGLKLLKAQLQQDFPAELFAVRMYCLVPE